MWETNGLNGPFIRQRVGRGRGIWDWTEEESTLT